MPEPDPRVLSACSDAWARDGSTLDDLTRLSHSRPVLRSNSTCAARAPTTAPIHSLAKLETELAKFASEAELTLNIRRTEPRPPRTELPYTIDAVCLDQTGVVSALAGFCSQRGIDIAEVSTHSYAAAHTGAQMFSVQMNVSVPSRIHLAHLREEFLDFCDARNLDAILDPVKS